MTRWEKIKLSIECVKVEELKKEISSFMKEVRKLASISSLSPEVKKCAQRVQDKCRPLNQLMTPTQRELERGLGKSFRKVQASSQEVTKMIKKLKTKMAQKKKEWVNFSSKIQNKPTKQEQKK